VTFPRTAIAAAAGSLLALSSLPLLAQEANTAQSVVVTATRFAERADALPFGVSVITAADLEAAGVTTVNEAVMKLLGVPGRADFYGGGDYALDLRGFGGTSDSNQVVILDGMRLSEADLGGTRLAGIPVNLIDRIEVIRGSGAVLYGEGATGGVIVITTQGYAGKRPQHGQVYAAGGSHHSWEARADASLPLGDVALDVAASQRESDNHRDNFRSKTGAGSVGAQWHLSDTLRLGARVSHDELHTGLPGALTAEQYAQNPRQTNNPQDKAAIRNDRLTLNAQAELAGWQLAFDAGWREKSLNQFSVSSFGPFTYAYDIKADSQSLRARRELELGGMKHALVAGVDFDAWKRQIAGDFGTLAKQRTNAVYLKDDVDLASGTRLALGARTEQLHKTLSGSDTRIDSRQNAWELGLTQKLVEGWAAYGRVGRSFRLATADEFSFTSPGVQLVPQTSRDAELGLRWAQPQWRAELRAYRSALRHEIGYDPAAAGPFGLGANVNFDPTRRQGLELESRAQLSRDWGASFNAALRQARFTEGPYDGKRVPLTAKATAALNLDWRVLPNQRLDAGVRYVSRQHPDFENQCAIPAYTTADARYSVQWGAVELALKVENLTDKRYYTQAFACSGGTPTAIYPEAGRTATASVRWTFL
jgi:iron complex outermembrane receptor protein